MKSHSLHPQDDVICTLDGQRPYLSPRAQMLLLSMTRPASKCSFAIGSVKAAIAFIMRLEACTERRISSKQQGIFKVTEGLEIADIFKPIKRQTVAGYANFEILSASELIGIVSLRCRSIYLAKRFK